MSVADKKEVKTCGKCGVTKSIELFYRRQNRRSGRGSQCQDCTKAAAATWRLANPDKLAATEERRRVRELPRKGTPERKAELRQQHLRRYNLTEEQYNNLLESQGGVCASCRSPEPGAFSNFHIDHDHACCPRGSCGKCIRGILCQSCNVALGQTKDRIEQLEALVVYLKTWELKILSPAATP